MLADHWQACFPENMVYENHLPVGEMVGAGILHRITDEAISYTHTHTHPHTPSTHSHTHTLLHITLQ